MRRIITHSYKYIGKIYVKKLAKKNIPTEILYIIFDFFLILRQVSLNTGSVGHGSNDDFLNRIPAIINITAVDTVICILYFDISINCGKKSTSEANVAPAPISIKRAGNAQQMSVDEDANSVIIPILNELSFRNII